MLPVSEGMPGRKRTRRSSPRHNLDDFYSSYGVTMLAPKHWTVPSADRRLLPKKSLGLLRGKKEVTSARDISVRYNNVRLSVAVRFTSAVSGRSLPFIHCDLTVQSTTNVGFQLTLLVMADGRNHPIVGWHLPATEDFQITGIDSSEVICEWKWNYCKVYLSIE